MNWFTLIAFFHLLSSLIILIVLIISLRKKNKNSAQRAFVFLVLAFLLWALQSLFSHVIANFETPSRPLSILGGMAVLAISYAGYTFCEFFPAGLEIKGYTKRLKSAAFITVVISLSIFTDEWIYNSHIKGGRVASSYGIFFYITSGWAILLILAGLSLVLLKYRRTEEKRKRMQIRLFVIGAGLNLLVTVLFSFVLPVMGYDKLFFLGPDAAMISLPVLVYAIIFHQLLDVRTATLRFILWLAVSFVVSLLFYFVYNLLLLSQNWIHFSLAQIIPLSIVFLMGIFYNRVLQNRIDTIFFPQVKKVEDLILNLIDKRFLKSGGFLLHRLLQTILETLADAFGFDKGFFLAVGHDNKLYFYGLQQQKIPIKARNMETLKRLQLRNRLPEAFLQELDQIILLEKATLKPFSGRAHFGQKYPHVVKSLQEIFNTLEQENFALLIPLLFQHEINGFLIIGPKRNGLPYYSHELKRLEAIRVFITMSLRNQTYLDAVEAEKAKAEEEVSNLTKFISQQETIQLSVQDRTLIFQSQAMSHVIQKSQDAAASTYPVLISGETGTGKELIARSIHENSDRHDKPFIVVNSAAIPATLWEDEIFGHVKGAFTDARSDREGLVAQARDGTLFFDEVGEIPLELQSKLLRLLQEHQFTPVGGSKPQKAQCRFIFATNRNLQTLQEKSEFRSDLFYRINVLPIHIPPLRQRKEDIPGLVEHFAALFSKDSNRPHIKFSLNAMDKLFYYDWPGNVRELENVIIRILAGAHKDTIEAEDIPLWTNLQKEKEGQGIQADNDSLYRLNGNFDELLHNYERRLIRQALRKSGGNKTQAAKLLGIKWGKLNYRIKELGLDANPK